MFLLFAAGVMDLLWVVVIASFVLAEKLAPFGRLFSCASGVALAAVGVGVIVG